MAELRSRVHSCERIGVVGSPSSNTSIAVDVTEEAYQKALVGNFCVMEFTQDREYVYPIGQVVSIVLRNPYLERHSIRKIVSVRGEASPLTEKHDVRLVEMVVGSSFKSNNGKMEPIIIGSVPPTGTHIYLLDQRVIDSIIEDHISEISIVGRMYNSPIKLPMIFKHFGEEYPGLGESYHIGVFGKTGSGKSYLARMILLSYARNKPMSIILIDPQGEYAKEVRNNGILKELLDNIGRSYEVIDVSTIALTSLNSLKRILFVSNFLDFMGVRAEENRENAADQGEVSGDSAARFAIWCLGHLFRCSMTQNNCVDECKRLSSNQSDASPPEMRGFVPFLGQVFRHACQAIWRISKVRTAAIGIRLSL